MKATDLNQALNYVDDAYLMEADTPEKEIITMKTKKRMLRILAAAALISLLTITAYAADLLHIRSLESGSSKYYEKYSDMDRAFSRAGLEADIPEEFENGFRFQGVEVHEVKAKDDNGKQVLTFQKLNAYYENELGQYLVLSAGLDLEAVPKTESIPAFSKKFGEVKMNYYLDHYKFVPPDYKLSEAEEEWAKQPGNYISYGSDEVEEKDCAFLVWTENGVYYFFFDRKAEIKPDVLFTMAEEIIQA